jgi:hypothetical protein
MKRREQEKKGGKERETGCGVVFIEKVFLMFSLNEALSVGTRDRDKNVVGFRKNCL